MLSRLIIRNYALIEDLDISFSGELNILTGETGAGKSIILGALSLLLGRRAENKYFFNQQKKCVIEGHFNIKQYHIADFFLDYDLDHEQETILRREVSIDGRSRAFVNDTPVTIQVLKQLGERLIDIHSQHATLKINEEEFQLLVLDAVAGNQSLLSSYQVIYKAYQQVLDQLKEVEQANNQAKIDQDYYQFLFDELEQARLIEGEQEHLEQELDKLSHAEDIKRDLMQANYLLIEDEQAVVTQLKNVIQNLQHAEKYQPEISLLVDRLSSSLIEIKDIAVEIAQMEQSTYTNENHLEQINIRLNTIYSLQKKHRVRTTSELITLKNALLNKLTTILSCEEDIERLKSEARKLETQALNLAADLSKKRLHVIPEIELQVQKVLSEVNMSNAILQIKHSTKPEGKINKTGLDQIQFLFNANKGQELLPLNQVASGGELSRLMLSVKSLIARHTALPTIIFDEIDTGVSGAIAFKMGNIIEKLSQSIQVITITHLPQIASKGKAHYLVYKEEKGAGVHTRIEHLAESERVIEIAKMLSGENPGEYALQNARELLSV